MRCQHAHQRRCSRLNELPESVLIVGRRNRCEFSIFRTFGCEVTMVDIMPNILPMVDEDANIARAVAKRHQDTYRDEDHVGEGR